eukprot:3558584-Rhodomonas_salina.1
MFPDFPGKIGRAIQSLSTRPVERYESLVVALPRVPVVFVPVGTSTRGTGSSTGYPGTRVGTVETGYPGTAVLVLLLPGTVCRNTWGSCRRWSRDTGAVGCNFSGASHTAPPFATCEPSQDIVSTADRLSHPYLRLAQHQYSRPARRLSKIVERKCERK